MDAKDCEQYSTDHDCCTCRNKSFTDLKLKYDWLEKRNKILEEAVEYCSLWRCPLCGYYSMPDFKCHVCGYDRTE